jgi:GH25 family lysozyme M1 (1,4-beta-N-acetylmuramidase)
MTIVPVVHDLAHFNSCNFSQFKAGGGLGIIHKASQSHIDDRVVRRLPLIKSVGLLAGCYHFNQIGAKVTDQIALFLRSIKAAGFDKNDLAALDWEPPAISHTDALDIMDGVEQSIGRYSVLYGGSVIKEQMPHASSNQRDAFAKRRLWLSEYGPVAKMTDVNGHPLPWSKYWLWQYTGDGIGPEPHSMPGTAHGADLNTFAGSADELRAQWAGEAVGVA